MTDLEPLVSVVIPTRNEEGNAVQIAEAVIGELERSDVSFDLIFIDNGSHDRTVPLLRELCARDPRVRLIINVRDFGQMRSPTHAIFQARGKAVINMCADFQDPPELLPRFIEKWRAGADIVLGVRASEQSSPGLHISRSFAYWFGRRFGDYPIIRNATGFGLYDAKVVRAIAKLNEPEPFFRGILVEIGYAIETIAYQRPARAAGKSNNNFFSLLDFSLAALALSSKRLVRTPFYAGLLALTASVIALVGAFAAALVGAHAWRWFCIFLAEFNAGCLFIFIGVLGSQIRMISERTRKTPLVIERERVNFPEGY